jgi:peptidoglycan/LPS O-acetylase OafA/YrhL
MARLSVLVFFVLSGFVIARSITGDISRHGYFDVVWYGIRRIVRIYPPYLFTLALVAFLANVAGLKPWQTMEINLPGVVVWLKALPFLFRSAEPIGTLDGPLWSLRIEIGLYLIAAVVALAYVNKGLKKIGLIFVATALVSALCAKVEFGWIGLALFAFGAIAGIAMQSTQLKLIVWRPIAVFATLFPLVYPMLASDNTASQIYQVFLGIPIAAILLLLALASASASTITSSSRVVSMFIASGAWSYTLYIMHYPVLLMMAQLVGRISLSLRILVFFFCVFAVNALAYLVALVLERPSYFTEIIVLALRALRLRA